MTEATPEDKLKTLGELGLATHELRLPADQDAPAQVQALLAGASEQTIRLGPGHYALRLGAAAPDASAPLLAEARITPIGAPDAPDAQEAPSSTAAPLAEALDAALSQQLAALREVAMDSEAEMARRFDDLETVCMQLSEALADAGSAEAPEDAGAEAPEIANQRVAVEEGLERLAALIAGQPQRLEAERRGLTKMWAALDDVVSRLDAAVARQEGGATDGSDGQGASDPIGERLDRIESRLDALTELLGAPRTDAAAEEAVADLRITLAEFMARHERLRPADLDATG